MQPQGRRALALVFAMLALAPALSGCVFQRESLLVAASAPKAASGMTLFLATVGSLKERVSDDPAEYRIYYGDRLIYPPGGQGAQFQVVDRKGSDFILYKDFVVGNGDYDIVLRYLGDESRVRVHIQKWAEYVYLHPTNNGDVVQVEVALSSATGGNVVDRILAQGDLVLALHYRGLDGKEDRTLGSLTTTTTTEKSTTLIDIPRSRFSAGPGYYSIEPVFHNHEAFNNLQVGADPTLKNRNPPWNWVYIRA